MTPEEIELFRESVKDCPFDDLVGKNREMILFLCDSALRLSAIENAGDEEVGLYFSHGRECANGDPVVEEALTHLRDIAKQRGLELADLRAKLGEATELLHMIYSKPMCDEMLDSEEGDRLLKFITESEVGSE